MTAKKKYGPKAKDLFVHQGWDYEQIGSLFNVSENTIRRWAKEGNWEDERVMVETSPFEMAFRLKQEIFNTIKKKQISGEKFDKGELDGLAKLMSIAARIEKKANILGHALIILRDMADFLKRHYPPQAKTLGQVFQPLTDYLYAKYSK